MAYEIPRPFYSTALKHEALQRVRVEGKALEQVARELGLSDERLATWLDADDYPLSGAFDMLSMQRGAARGPISDAW